MHVAVRILIRQGSVGNIFDNRNDLRLLHGREVILYSLAYLLRICIRGNTTCASRVSRKLHAPLGQVLCSPQEALQSARDRQ